jgi:hypothetical protein
VIFEPPHSEEARAAINMLRAMGWTIQFSWPENEGVWMVKGGNDPDLHDYSRYRLTPPNQDPTP